MILFILLALDVAALAHGDIQPNTGALIAAVLAVIGLVLELRGRGVV